MKTVLNQSVTITNGTAQYDTHAKRLIGHRSVLGYIAVNAIGPCRGMRPEEAAALIDGEVYIASVPVDPGQTNMAEPANMTPAQDAAPRGDRLIGLNTESAEVNEGAIYYDLLFYMNLPDGLAQIIVNVEIQRRHSLEYAILNRGIYYACRAISSQKDREFSGQNYDRIKSVYSIWLCMNEAQNSLTDYHLMPNTLIGDAHWPGNPDMLHIVMVGITSTPPAAELALELHRLLSTLLSSTMTSHERLGILQQEYHLPTEITGGEEANNMCNLGEALVEETAERVAAEITTEHVTRMFSKKYPADVIADALGLRLDEVRAILSAQGLLQA